MCNCFPCKIEFKNPFKEIYNYLFNSKNNKKPIHPLEKIIIDNTEYKEQSLENKIYYNPEFQDREQKQDVLYIEPDHGEIKTSLYDEVFYTKDEDNQSYSSAGASVSSAGASVSSADITVSSAGYIENASSSDSDKSIETDNSDASNNFSTTSSNWDILSD